MKLSIFFFLGEHCTTGLIINLRLVPEISNPLTLSLWLDALIFAIVGEIFSQFLNIYFWPITNQISPLWGVRWKQDPLNFTVCSSKPWSPLPYSLLTPLRFGSSTKVEDTLTSPRAVPRKKKTLTGVSGSGCFLSASGCPAAQVQAFIGFTAPWSSFEGSWFWETLTGLPSGSPYRSWTSKLIVSGTDLSLDTVLSHI